jgi:hypothetical protein
MTGRVTRAGVRAALVTEYAPRRGGQSILLAGRPVGNLVTFGRRDARVSAPRNALPKTVYAANVQVGGKQLRVDGASAASVLNKVATGIAPLVTPGDLVPDAPAPTPVP